MNCPYIVYVLRSTNPDYKRKTYVGCTKDRNRRLRQHNGEIVGGAKRTLKGRPWEMVCFFHNFPDKKTAYQMEYAIHHSGMKKKKVKCRSGKIRTREVLSNNYRGGGLEKRIQLISLVLQKTSFTKTCIPNMFLNLRLTWLIPGYSLPVKVPFLNEIAYNFMNRDLSKDNIPTFTFTNPVTSNNLPTFVFNSSPPNVPNVTIPTFISPANNANNFTFTSPGNNIHNFTFSFNSLNHPVQSTPFTQFPQSTQFPQFSQSSQINFNF